MAEAFEALGPQDEDGSVFFVSLSYKGTAYEVPVQEDDHLASIFDFVQEALDFPRENCKLIFRGKMLRPDNDSLTIGEAGLQSGSKVMLVASSSKDISFVQSSRADPLVKGFAEEERDEQNRRKRARAAAQSAWGTKQDSEFRFASIKAEFKYSEPPPYEAERLLQRLATDPGIIEIMKTRQFKVGILTEMSPVEAQERMAKKGTPNMDLLGYNQNYGEMIVLRLRTDTLKGFRPYHDLINTLVHELTHNVWGPHDNNFWKLFGELKAQYMKFHRFWSHGGRASDSNAVGQFGGFVGEDGDGQAAGSFGQVLGGSSEAPLTEAERRARALAAAEGRSISGPSDFDASPFVPNFLASNGTWMFMCPCGQVHEIDGLDCPVALASNAPATSSQRPAATETAAATTPEITGAVDGDTTKQTAEPLATDSTHGQRSQQEPLDIFSDLHEQPSETARAAEQQPAPTEPDAVVCDAQTTPSTCPQPTETEQRPTPMEVCDEAEIERLPEPVVEALDISDLAEQGLDGAAIWVQRFSSQLKALSRSRDAASRASAMELLLRLVRNVVENPNDPKFRRIRADNPKVRSALLEGVPDAEAIFRLLGFEAVTESNGERVFVLRDATFDCARLRLGKELLEMELTSSGLGKAR